MFVSIQHPFSPLWFDKLTRYLEKIGKHINRFCVKNMLHMGVHLRATCEQLEGKKKEKQGKNQKSKDFNMQQRSTNKKNTWIVSGYF